MAAQQIPSGYRGVPLGSRGGGDHAGFRLTATNRVERGGTRRRHRPDRFPFSRISYFCTRHRRMSKDVRHIPVLGREAVEMLAPRDGVVYVDATFGAGGYSRSILATVGTRVIGIDRDRTAIAGGFDLVDQSGGRLTLVGERLSHLVGI